MTIASWPQSERPREKLLASGATSLSDAELLALFLQTGCRGKTALDLAREMPLQNLSRSLSAHTIRDSIARLCLLAAQHRRISVDHQAHLNQNTRGEETAWSRGRRRQADWAGSSGLASDLW